MAFRSESQRRKLYAMADEGEISRDVVDEFQKSTPKGKKLPEKVALLRTQLMPHQERAVIRAGEQPGLVIAHGLGSGKTLTSIAIAEGEEDGAIALVPASLQQNYLKEIQKHTKGKQRVVVKSLQGAVVTGDVPDASLLIVDEAHRARNPQSKTRKLIQDAPVERRVLLTASPVYNRPADIAPLVNMAAGEKILPEGAEFRKRFIRKPDSGLWGLMPWSKKREVLIRKGELRQALQKWVDYHPPSGKDFPSKSEQRIAVPMTKRQTQIHDGAWGKLPLVTRLRLKRGLPPEKKELAALNKFQAQVRQVSGSEKAFGGEGSTPKVQAAVRSLERAIEGNPEHRALVYSNYLSVLNDYAADLDSRGVSYGLFTGEVTRKRKRELVDQYNTGKIKALLVSSAGGEGLDLKGTRQVQVLDPHWNNEKIEQVIGRAVRHGSHSHLPVGQRHVDVERYEAVPLAKKIRLRKQRSGIEGMLYEMSDTKDRLNQQVLDLLSQRTEKVAESDPAMAYLQEKLGAAAPNIGDWPAYIKWRDEYRAQEGGRGLTVDQIAHVFFPTTAAAQPPPGFEKAASRPSRISFPEGEHASLKKRLADGKDVYTTRVSAERGKYQEGQVLQSPFGELRVKSVQQSAGIGEHPFRDELTLAQRKQIGTKLFDLVQLTKTAVAPRVGPPPERNRKEWPYQGTIKFRGLLIMVENRRGSYRGWTDDQGKTGKTKMLHHYGEVRRTLGPDGDPVDVYVGPDLDSDVVYIVHQMKTPDFKKYDEDKCMLGFHSAKEAKQAYLKHYNDKRFFGSMTTMSFEDFRKLLKRRDVRGKRLTEGLIKLGGSMKRIRPEDVTG